MAAEADADRPAPAGDSSALRWIELFSLKTGALPLLILFVFGGGLLSLYYAGIGYFPEFTWQDALTSLGLLTIIGGSLLVAYGFLLFLPGAIWSVFLIYDDHFSTLFKIKGLPNEPCVWSITKYLLVPFALFMTFCHALFSVYSQGEHAAFVPLGALASLLAVSGLVGRNIWKALPDEELEIPVAAGQESAASPPAQPALPAAPEETRAAGRSKGPSWRRLMHYGHVTSTHLPLPIAAYLVAAGMFNLSNRVIWWGLALLPLASLVILAMAANADGLDRPAEKKSRRGRHWSILCRSLLAFGTTALLSLAALWFFYRIYQGGTPTHSGEISVGLLLLCSLVVVLAALGVSVLFHDYGRHALKLSFLSALLLLGAGHLLGTSVEGRLPAKIMARFGFGQHSATLVLTEKGGRLLDQHKIAVTQETRTDQKEPIAKASGLTLLSRLGSEYLVRAEQHGKVIALPKAEVLSWSKNPCIPARLLEDRSFIQTLIQGLGVAYVAPHAHRITADNTLELDALAWGANSTVYLVEVDCELADALEELQKKRQAFPKFYPEHANKKVEGIVVAVRSTAASRQKVFAQGLYLGWFDQRGFQLKGRPPSFEARKVL